MDVSQIEEGTWGLGVIICNSDGQIMEVKSNWMVGENNLLPAETMAMKIGLYISSDKDIKRLRIKLDCLEFVKLMNHGGDYLLTTSTRRICHRMVKMKQQLQKIDIVQIPREKKKTKHEAARICVSKSIENINNPDKHKNNRPLEDKSIMGLKAQL
ncbi:unnamed protein product [Vicia faba]|uniref:RNase H type-1 domain-containing protein n=1 Tax=Vicia faba TaxID=3906 RepID=A0AAV1BA08_VICFA|nr:unnamed protein product [Vicia faba]